MSGTYTASTGQISPFDIQGQQRAIADVMSSLPASQRGQLTLSVRRGEGAKVALVVRGPAFGPLKTEIVGSIVPPIMGKTLDYGGAIRVNWLAAQVIVPCPAPFGRYRGWYRLLRGWNGRLVSAVKAAAIMAGLDVRIM